MKRWEIESEINRAKANHDFVRAGRLQAELDDTPGDSVNDRLKCLYGDGVPDFFKDLFGGKGQ